ncbi:putative cytoplasm protein [Cutaneotrichosporon oleaginosum]|uniref:Putative cytoplasm protein n=1 Tax=Cutaneotrichosporon oleaginosum TaxID=879819 RepID=A0A0J0XNY5_9TREE|nr:putative cytoplasm protein [Cutaneotrichosporon oleaginosum]KLT42866.1 putative cytoplasm protein [Cutaneotrichosporon oleaginosum]
MGETEERTAIPVTCFTGFLGAGKTTTILGLLGQLPKDYKVVLLKNEYGDVEVDSLLAQQSNITGVSEILNGCLCCTMVGLVENALIEIRDKFKPDRIIIESSGSAFPATLALQIRSLEPQGFKLDGVVTVIDCVNFRGYEDDSPSAKLQAQYTDLHILSKHEEVSEREFDILLDRLGDLTDSTPHVKISREKPLTPELVFGLDSTLFLKGSEEADTWAAIGGEGAHIDEVQTKSVWRGGRRPGKHEHADGKECGSCQEEGEVGEVQPLPREELAAQLKKFEHIPEIYRIKGIVRFPSAAGGYESHVLNWAFGKYELTRMPALDDVPDLAGVSLRLTVMGERGEVARPARMLAEGLGAQVA